MSRSATHKALSVLTIVIVMMAMLLQFHQHDCHGNISWHLTTHADFTIGEDGCNVAECHPEHETCGLHSHNHHGHGTCPLHIAVAVTSQDMSAPVGADLHWHPEAIAESDPDVIFQPELTRTFGKRKTCSCYRAPLLASFRFRGPPAFVA